jgi:6-phosphofructokinase 1
VSLEGKRYDSGIIIGTSRANPGQICHLRGRPDDQKRNRRLRNMDNALRSLSVDALISIGGDDTLSTAAKFQVFQKKHYATEQRIRVIHLPKTIDSDYHGIDFTFGYFTAVDMMAQEIRNLRTDAQANNSYFVVQSMGRKADWLSYGAAVAGEASLVLSLEDISDELWTSEDTIDPKTGDTILDDGKPRPRRVFDVGRVVDCVVDTMLARERQGKQYGVILVAEGLAEHLPVKELRACLSEEEFQSLKPDPYGNYPVSQVPFSRRLAKLAFDKYRELPEEKKMVRARRLIGLQFGYEVRTHPPTAFDIILGSQLGVGAYRCLAEKNSRA